MSVEKKYEQVLNKQGDTPDSSLMRDIFKAGEQKGEVVVPVEQLIPGIKPRSNESKLSFEESRDSGRNFSDALGRFLPILFDLVFDRPHPGEDGDRLSRAFKDQVVVDLGAGNVHGFFAVYNRGARGYVAVDKYTDLSDNYRKIDLPNLPVACVQEDALEFLRRLPNDSVSIIASGLDENVLPNEKYNAALRQEVQRVLSKSGVLVQNESIRLIDLSSAERLYDISPTFYVFAKK